MPGVPRTQLVSALCWASCRGERAALTRAGHRLAEQKAVNGNQQKSCVLGSAPGGRQPGSAWRETDSSGSREGFLEEVAFVTEVELSRDKALRVEEQHVCGPKVGMGCGDAVGMQATPGQGLGALRGDRGELV